MCVCLLNLPQFGIVASQVRVLSLSLRSCSTTGPAAAAAALLLLLLQCSQRAYVNNNFVRPSVAPATSVCLGGGTELCR